MSGRRCIFISSVQKEFIAERRALKSFIDGDPLLRRFFDVFLFEDVPASGQRADHVYLREVDRCDVYIALIGREYGYKDREGVSPTEREFDRAAQAKKERLVFVKGTDDKARQPKTVALLRKVGDQVVRRRFETIPEVIAGVYASLVEYLGQAGDIRSLPFDASACPKAIIDDLAPDKVEAFLEKARRQRSYALDAHTPIHDALTHLNLLDHGLPTFLD